MYLIEILHQTTTVGLPEAFELCCILSKFYIKPQQIDLVRMLLVVVSYRNSTSNHNITPFAQLSFRLYLIEILHQTTTELNTLTNPPKLYLIEILHQTTTLYGQARSRNELYLIEILHQTTTNSPYRGNCWSCILSKFYIKPQPPLHARKRHRRCILSKFYIKPQPIPSRLGLWKVVSYRNSTSNHNSCLCSSCFALVVSYRNSTSNHNVGPHID